MAASAGLQVCLYDVRKEFLTAGMDGVVSSLNRIAAKKYATDEKAAKAHVSNIVSRISLTTDVGFAAKEADLVVEAIVENLPVKQEIFKRIDAIAPAKCIFASNTSSLSIGDIAAQTSPERRAAFAGLHFFNPVPMMKLASSK